MCHVVHSVLESRPVFRVGVLLVAAAFGPHGALAQQAPANQSAPQVITCISKAGERQVCPADHCVGRGVVALDR